MEKKIIFAGMNVTKTCKELDNFHEAKTEEERDKYFTNARDEIIKALQKTFGKSKVV